MVSSVRWKLSWLCLLVACHSEAASAPPVVLGSSVAEVSEAGRAGMRPAFCARPGDDRVRDVFCGAKQPAVTSLRALQDLMQVNPASSGDDVHDDARSDPFASVPVAVLLAHSTALSGRLVSPINPRAIVLGREVILTFQRGTQQVELASVARGRGTHNFYLLTFSQACNGRAEGCLPGDLYTPRIERDWTAIEVRDDEDLKNTPFDCRQCHQRGREEPVLLMRELQSPWTHFFERDTRGDAPEDPATQMPGVRGRDLLGDYERAKGDEPYAELALPTIRATIGLLLQNVVPPVQPLLFDAPKIEDERWPYGPEGFPREPRPSPSWERAWGAFKRGEQLALPHYEARPTDPAKQARLTAAYQQYRAGTLSAEALPDLADVFPDDPQARAYLGLQNEPGATPAEALIQTCGPCHNDVLDPSISRARFNIALSRMSGAARSLAIARLALPTDAPGAMPPPDARQLDAEARERLMIYLRDDARPPEDDALLEHAAQAGMMGGGGS